MGAAMAAAKHNAGNLIVLADCNNNQSGGKVTELDSLYPAHENGVPSMACPGN